MLLAIAELFDGVKRRKGIQKRIKEKKLRKIRQPKRLKIFLHFIFSRFSAGLSGKVTSKRGTKQKNG